MLHGPSDFQQVPHDWQPWERNFNCGDQLEVFTRDLVVQVFVEFVESYVQQYDGDGEECWVSQHHPNQTTQDQNEGH